MIASKELLASSCSPIAIARALGWPRCLKDFVYPTPSKAPEFNAAIDDQGESSLEPEKQLALWQGEIAREAQQGRGIDALQRVLSKLKKEFGTDEAFLFRAIDDLQQCAVRHLSGHYATEIIISIFGAIFPDPNCDLDHKAIKIDDRLGRGESMSELASSDKPPEPIQAFYGDPLHRVSRGWGMQRETFLTRTLRSCRPGCPCCATIRARLSTFLIAGSPRRASSTRGISPWSGAVLRFRYSAKYMEARAKRGAWQGDLMTPADWRHHQGPSQ